MTEEEREIATEQRHVDKAFDRLEELRHRARGRRARAEADRSGSTPQSVFERDVAVHHLVTWSSSLDAGAEGLIFGRIDMSDGEIFRIGRLGLRNRDYEPLVLDWRAPASAPFYRATPTDHQGVLRRRTIRLRGRKVLGIEDDLLDASSGDDLALIGDGALMAAVGRAKSEHMRDIVQTIQREQDEVIRAPARGVLLVTGGPGTGKTAVALHRVAYLLYESRERYMRGGVLIVGPTPRFMAYVGKVLPSLGEDSTLLRSLGEFAPGVAVDSTDDSTAAAVKGSLDMLPFLDRAIASLITAPWKGIRLRYEGADLSADEKTLERIKGRLLRTRRPYNELAAAARVELARALLDDDDETAISGLIDETRFERLASEWWPQGAAVSVFYALASGALAPLEELGEGIFGADQLDALRASWEDGRISQNDVAVIDELATRLGHMPQPPPPEETDDDYPEVSTFADRTSRRRRSLAELDPDTFAHVVVDEAQDMSPMQWRMLWRRGEAATWTVVGDWAQSAWADPAESRRAFDALIGGRVFTEKHLDTNYRGAQEIAQLGDRLLKSIDPQAEPPRSVRSSGHTPELIDRTNELYKTAADALAGIGERVDGTVAAIVPIGRLDEATKALDGTGAQILSSIEAKGLEFDGAVVINPTEMVSEHVAGLRLLYVAITRAAHILSIVSEYDEAELFPTLVSADGQADRSSGTG